MDTNRYEPTGNDPNQQQYTTGNDPNQQQYTYTYSQDQYTGGYGGYYNAYDQGQRGRNQHGRKGWKGALIAILMVICLIGGSAIGVFLLSPGIHGTGPTNVAAAPTIKQSAPAESKGVNEQSEPLTTDNPQIGGQAPNIDSAVSPYVQIVQKVSPAVVGIAVSDQTGEDVSAGTGVVLTADGYILTNNHVISIEGRGAITVTMSDGKEYKAGIVGSDETTDLAVLKINATGLTAAALGDSDKLQVGEEVVAIGNALGLGSGTVTRGIVSGLNKEIYSEGYTQEYIQTDAAINPGNSGGPLINMSGEVIGINTLKSYIAGYNNGQAVTSEGIGFAIPIKTALPIIQQLMTKGSVERPGIGIGCGKSTGSNTFGAPEGVVVISVTEGGPADIAGLQVNDVILSADGKAVAKVEELTTIIKSHKVGDTLNLTVWRNGQEYQASVTVGDLNKIG